MTPARHMKDEAIERELRRVHTMWDAFLRTDRDGGGSPGEWMVERMDELETEQKRRAAGGEIDRTVPLQSA